MIKKYINYDSTKTNSELVSEIYNILKTEYRNEYYYKNTLLNKLLLGIHSVNTTTALTEIPIAKSKADFVLINGKAVVYEIKTELDNLEMCIRYRHNIRLHFGKQLVLRIIKLPCNL